MRGTKCEKEPQKIISNMRIYRWYDQLAQVDNELQDCKTFEQHEEFTQRLNWIEKQVSEITVPLGYSQELYDMRIHIEMLRGKLGKCETNVLPMEEAPTQRKFSNPA